jgi:GNAT superfamily N-acetyltransferase
MDLRRTLGAAGRLWAAPEHHAVTDDWWIACSGQLNVNYNLAFSQSSDPTVLLDHCLQPVLDIGRPAIIMLSGAGLATAQTLAEAGWATVGALPLMTLTSFSGRDADRSGIRRLSAEDLPEARELLSDTYGLDDGSALAAVPDRLAGDDDMGAWGLFDGHQLASCFTGIVEDGLFVVWSMATRRDRQGRGHGHRLLHTVLSGQFERGVHGSMLQSSVAGRKLYLGLGYAEVEHWQLWSRPRWIMANA